MTAEVKVGKIYTGRVVSIKDFGAFVEIAPETDGLCHVSELSDNYVERVTDFVNVGDEVKVKVILIDDQGRIKLSRKAAMKELGETDPEPVGTPAGGDGGDETVTAAASGGGGRGGSGGGDRGGRGGSGGGDRGPRREGGGGGGDRGPRAGGGGGDRGPRREGGGGGGDRGPRPGGGGDRGPRPVAASAAIDAAGARGEAGPMPEGRANAVPAPLNDDTSAGGRTHGRPRFIRPATASALDPFGIAVRQSR